MGLTKLNATTGFVVTGQGTGAARSASRLMKCVSDASTTGFTLTGNIYEHNSIKSVVRIDASTLIAITNQ